MAGVDVHVVAHTHWDREWYATREQFRVRLVTHSGTSCSQG